jgi:hypothetical protein
VKNRSQLDFSLEDCQISEKRSQMGFSLEGCQIVAGGRSAAKTTGKQ